MRYFKFSNTDIRAYEIDGTQDDLIAMAISAGAEEITQEQAIAIYEAANQKAERIIEIRFRLNEINMLSIPLVRAVVTGVMMDDDANQLNSLQSEYIDLQEELSQLEEE